MDLHLDEITLVYPDGDATLTAVARARPRSNAALLQIAGVGPVKAQRYGPELLRLVGAE